MDLSEEELLEAIRTAHEDRAPEVRIGIGDDAAVLAPLTAEIVLTTDVLVEGVHFDPRLTSASDLGYKAMVVNLSDIAAMAASPRAAVCALTISDGIDASWVMEVFGGLREACHEYALSLVGGDLSRGPCVSIAVTVIGEVDPGGAVPRSGARAGDAIVVTGTLGAAATALRLERSGRVLGERERGLLRAHFRPIARVNEAKALAGFGATGMIDVSDGLTLDLSRLCKSSGVGARLRISDVPVAAGATIDDALGGGEDYEILATMPRGAVDRASRDLRKAFGVALTMIGEVVTKAGLRAVQEDGSEQQLEPRGWDHFERR